jgi:hypothetical protein
MNNPAVAISTPALSATHNYLALAEALCKCPALLAMTPVVDSRYPHAPRFLETRQDRAAKALAARSVIQKMLEHDDGTTFGDMVEHELLDKMPGVPFCVPPGVDNVSIMMVDNALHLYRADPYQVLEHVSYDMFIHSFLLNFITAFANEHRIQAGNPPLQPGFLILSYGMIQSAEPVADLETRVRYLKGELEQPPNDYIPTDYVMAGQHYALVQSLNAAVDETFTDWAAMPWAFEADRQAG